jgi:magnesium-transporting ATPase (P-type)
MKAVIAGTRSPVAGNSVRRQGRSSRRHPFVFVRTPRMVLSVQLLFLLLSVGVVVRAEFGDYAADPNTCPLITTCPTICEAALQDCSNPDLCDSLALTLCDDGHCRSSCSNSYPNPCPCGVACPKEDQVEYENCPLPSPLECSSAASASSSAKTMFVLFSEVTLLALLLGWVGTLTAAIVAFCRWKKTAATSTATAAPLRAATTAAAAAAAGTVEGGGGNNSDDGVVMTGYTRCGTGTLLYMATVGTIALIQFLLFVLVLLYYVQQGAITAFQATHEWNDQDEKRILTAFEVTWMVGFAWCLWICYPQNLRSLFWERCVDPSHAETVAVWTPSKLSHGVIRSDPTVSALRRFVNQVQSTLHTVLSATFSHDPSYRHGTWTYCPVLDEDGSRYFVHNFRRYILQTNSGNNASGNGNGSTYVPAEWKCNKTLADFAKSEAGLTEEQVRDRRGIVGPNSIEMKAPSFARTLRQEFTSTFYLYQNFIMWSWMPLYYYYMAIVQTCVIVTGGFVVCVFRYRNETSLYRLSVSEGTVAVRRDGRLQSVPAQALVPGDVVQVAAGTIHCDMVLIREDILVDESALTGESNPIPKSAVDPNDDRALFARQKRHTLQAGTTVVESDDHAYAVVTHTGSFTTKGELLREIFAFQRHQFKFDVEVPVVLMILFLYTVIAFSIVVANLRYSIEFAWFYGMYVVAACLPPLLPTAFTVSVGVSDNRLRKHHNVACTNSEDIIIAGKVRLAFFDKTGTLTKQGLEFIAAHSMEHWSDDMEQDHRSAEISMGMASCHSLVVSQSAGELIGNPVDRTMFAASGARLRNGTTIVDANGNQLEILRHFDFDHHRMTLSTIVKTEDGRILAFVKGSGESVSRLCTPSTLPSDFHDTLRTSAKAGVYQISMAIKELSTGTDVMQVARDDIETDLKFLGVINFRNVMREETPAVIQELEGGEIRCVMVTGDSVLTAISIAKEASMIMAGRKVLFGSLDSHGGLVWRDEDDDVAALPSDLERSNVELAVTGELWSWLLQSDLVLAAELADYIRVYGRCTPSDKVSEGQQRSC